VTVSLAVSLVAEPFAVTHRCHETRAARRRVGHEGPRMGFFDQLASAFENDDELGEAGPAGLKTKAKIHRITWVGPDPEGMAALFEKPEESIQEAIAGYDLKMLADQADIPLKFSCMQGTCGICDVLVDGETVPACTAKMPNRDCTIQYKSAKQASSYSKDKMKAYAAERKAAKAAGRPPPKQTVAEVSEVSETVGRVQPANPFGGNPFGGNPFAKPEAEAPAADDSDEPAWLKRQKAAGMQQKLEDQLSAENAAKKKGWPFG